MKTYFLSGLGADSRAFQYLTFPEKVQPIFIDWLEPLENESIKEYAFRISKLIDTSEPFVLIGLSFGGILATEVIEFVKPYKTILISSVCNRNELPLYYRMAGKLHLNKILPTKSFNRGNFLMYWLFGLKKKSEKHLLNEILTFSNTRFTKWAINEILNWKRETCTKNIIRIHGNKDKVLPILNFKPDFLIENGGHLMVVNKAIEISIVITQLFIEEKVIHK